MGVLALQRTIGNRAVAWMLENGELVESRLLSQSLEAEQAAGAAAAGAGGAASARTAGAQIEAGPDPDLIEFDLRSPRRRSPR